MKKLLLLIAVLLPLAGFGQSTPVNEFSRLSFNERGRVFFETIYNVYNRSNDEILLFAVNFANDQGVPSTAKMIDKENEEFTTQFQWTFKGSDQPCLENTVITAKVTFAAKQNRTRIYASDITYTSAGACKKAGNVEELQYCGTCKKRWINAFQDWMKVMIEERFFAEYKKYLEESVKNKRTW